jgi:UDP-N-acetylmuramate dehydrogenase
MTPLRSDVPLSGLTSYRIGGPARWCAAPRDDGEVIEALRRACTEGLPVLIVGRGSNLLVSDRGWPGLALDLSNMTDISWEGGMVTAQAGALLDAVASEAVRLGRRGMEDLSGIPGSVGGAVVMNAGAYSQCVADTFQEAACLDLKDYSVVRKDKDALGFGYRSSTLQGKKAVVLSARFLLEKGDADGLGKVRHAVLEKRRAVQPLDLPNCGSIFKRPAGGFAGALIEQAGLKGFRHGNAQISPKHANFIVNLGGATARDVRHLIVLAREKVYENSGILLEPEVVFAGEFDEELFKPK